MKLTRFTSILAVAAVFGALSSPVLAGTSATINELRISSGVDDDNDNFFELAGVPGESLNGLSLVVISDEFNPGLINNVFSLDGLSIPADGFFLAGNSTLFPSADLDTTGVDFFGSPSSFLLVSNFTGGVEGDDLDLDDNGAFDAPAFDALIDSVSLVDGDATTDFSQSPTVVGPAGAFPPAHVFRFPNGSGDFFIGEFGDTSADTPGTANIPEPAGLAIALLSILGLGACRRR